jgi:hypothetical protein
MPTKRGGPRPGSGRKPGSTTRKTREIADAAAAAGITPLEVMLLHMRQLYEQGDLKAAADRAVDCAPYMHPRLASVQATGKDGGPIQQEITHRQSLENLTAAELETMQALLEKAGAAAVH